MTRPICRLEAVGYNSVILHEIGAIKMETKRISCTCDNGFRKCFFCEGTGSAWELDGTPFPSFAQPRGGRRITCPECKGQGGTTCVACNGVGYHSIRMPSSFGMTSTNQVNVSREECHVCDGRGWCTCPSCNGTKYVLVIGGHIAGSATPFERNSAPCPTCSGAAAVWCPECDGTGYLSRGHTYGSGRDKTLRPYRG
jgi:DnaJ-class molecular chaperone